MLSVINHHDRDDSIQFEPIQHKYTIDGDSGYISVTTWIHTFFQCFDPDAVIQKMRKSKNWSSSKYYNLTDSEIKEEWATNGRDAADLGTLMHLNIENYYNGLEYTENFTNTKEYKLFQNYLQDHLDYKAYRTEWCVFSKHYKLAGSIDMVYIDPKDSTKVIIADWKRSKEIKMDNKWEKGLGVLKDIDNCNFWHYTIQLNVYKLIIEKYYGKTVSEMFLVILHPNQDDYIKIPIADCKNIVLKMFKERLNDLKK